MSCCSFRAGLIICCLHVVCFKAWRLILGNSMIKPLKLFLYKDFYGNVRWKYAYRSFRWKKLPYNHRKFMKICSTVWIVCSAVSQTRIVYSINRGRVGFGFWVLTYQCNLDYFNHGCWRVCCQQEASEHDKPSSCVLLNIWSNVSLSFQLKSRNLPQLNLAKKTHRMLSFLMIWDGTRSQPSEASNR